MKILLVHNYLRAPSGENTVFEQERDLLLSKGHSVVTYTLFNRDIEKMDVLRKAMIPLRSFWSFQVCSDISAIIGKEKPDVAHFHNIFPLITPAAYHACSRRGVPVVQTLHHYRIVCPGAQLFRHNAVCTECAGMHFLTGIQYGCYRNSRLFTAGISSIVLFHKWIGTWQKSIDLYIALSDFALKQYKKLGFPSDNFFVKPNFLQNPAESRHQDNGYGIYMGRLGEEKGMNCLLSALNNCPDIPFMIIGDGPLRDDVIRKISEWGMKNVEYMGILPHEQCMHILAGARFHVLPSLCYEGNPMVMLEAMSAGKPSIVSDIGVLAMMVRDGVDGCTFQPGSAVGLSGQMRYLHDHAEESRTMGKKARERFDQYYSADVNHQLMMESYTRAMEIHDSKGADR